MAYAASFGTDNLEGYSDEEIDSISSIISNFEALGFRENSGKLLCEQYFKKEAKEVLDPTFLLSKSDYSAIADSANTEHSKGDLLCYILDKSSYKDSIINTIAETNALTPFSVNVDIWNESLAIDDRIQISVEQWLKGFSEAEYVVTDSFHACVFSIIFNKPFIVIGNARRGLSRFYSLLKLFNLENRLLLEEEEIDKIFSLPAIDYKLVNDLLRERRQDSIDFLAKYIKH